MKARKKRRVGDEVAIRVVWGLPPTLKEHRPNSMIALTSVPFHAYQLKLFVPGLYNVQSFPLPTMMYLLSPSIVAISRRPLGMAYTDIGTRYTEDR